MKIGLFQGCTAISCARQVLYKKTYSNYTIEETCRYAQNNTCTYRRSKIEVKRPEQKAPESVGVA